MTIRHLFDEQIELEIVRVYRLGESAIGIAAQMHCSVPTIYKILHRRAPGLVDNEHHHTSRRLVPLPQKVDPVIRLPVAAVREDSVIRYQPTPDQLMAGHARPRGCYMAAR